MNIKKASQLLDETAKELKIAEDIEYPAQTYNIVEFCQKVLNFSDEDTVKFTSKYIGTFSSVEVQSNSLTEASSLLGRTISNASGAIGDRIRAMRGRQGIQRPEGVSGGPVNAVRNYFATKGSLVNNSPMIKVSTPGDTRYFVIPNLDTSKPEHQQILNDIIKAQTNSNVSQVATQVNPGDPERLAAQKYNKLTTLKPDFAADKNKKNVLLPALQELGVLISKIQQDTQNDLIVSQPEIDRMKQQASAILNKLSEPAPAGEAPKVEAELNKDITAAVGGEGVAPASAMGTGTVDVNGVPTQVPTHTPFGNYKEEDFGNNTTFADAYAKALSPTTGVPAAPTPPVPPPTVPAPEVPLAPAPTMPQPVAPQGNPANVLPTVSPTAPPVNVALPQAGKPTQLQRNQFIAPNPTIPALQQPKNIITNTPQAAAPTMPKPVAPLGVPATQDIAAGDLSPEAAAQQQAQTRLARFGNTQNANRQYSDLAAGDIPSNLTAPEQSQMDLKNYLDRKRKER